MKGIAERFRQTFSHLRGCPIALYGVGEVARDIVIGADGWNIVALLDQSAVGQVRHGLPVLTTEDAAGRCTAIVIAARAEVVDLIFARLSSVSDRVAVYDMSGRRLLAPSAEPNPVFDVGDEAALCCAIDAADAVSFDVWDTLLTRKTLRPEHAMLRADEFDCAVPRSAVVRAFNRAASRCPVFVLSDYHRGASDLVPLLAKHGISGQVQTLVSCDHGDKSKANGGLFDVLISAAGKRVLHVGDDAVADVASAHSAGIEPFRVLSGYEMLRRWRPGILRLATAHSDACALGLWVARALNSPWALHGKSARVGTAEDFGYLGFGASCSGLVQWATEIATT